MFDCQLRPQSSINTVIQILAAGPRWLCQYALRCDHLRQHCSSTSPRFSCHRSPARACSLLQHARHAAPASRIPCQPAPHLVASEFQAPCISGRDCGVKWLRAGGVPICRQRRQGGARHPSRRRSGRRRPECARARGTRRTRRCYRSCRRCPTRSHSTHASTLRTGHPGLPRPAHPGFQRLPTHADA